MNRKISEKQIGKTFWLKHAHSWFAFEEPAYFKVESDGGYFASRDSHQPVRSVGQNISGFQEPDNDLIQESQQIRSRKP